MSKCCPEGLRLLDGADAADEQALYDHVDGCPACRAAVAAQADWPERLPAAGNSPFADEPAYRRVVERALVAGHATSPDADGPFGRHVALKAFGYDILEELGRGGMGIVYKARQLKLNRLVALKAVSGGNAEARRRFLREAEAAAAVRHPYIVQVFECFEHEGQPYLAMELHPGSLAGKLARGPLPPADAAAILEKVARAVQAAHEAGVIHRDLKPGNVLLADDGSPRVSDFGLAKLLGGDHSLPTVRGAGTPSYMAPEQAARGDADATADVYSLGAVLYECLVGRPPFRATTHLETMRQAAENEPVPPRAINPDVPTDIETVCLKCLQKQPTRRYASAAPLADDLARWLDGRPIEARPAGPFERAWKWLRRNPAPVAVMALLLVVAAAATGLSLLAASRAQAESALRAAEAEASEARAEASDARARAAEARQGELLARFGSLMRLALQRGGSKEALALFGRAVAEGVEVTPRMRLDRVRALMSSGGHDEAALEVHKPWAANVPDGLRAERDLLKATALVGRDDETSAKLFDKALKGDGLAPADRDFARGMLAGTTPEAIGWLEKALQNDPAHLEARAMLGVALLSLGRVEEMVRCAEQGRVIAPRSPVLLGHLVIGNAFLGKDREAKGFLELAKAETSKADLLALRGLLVAMPQVRRVVAGGAPDWFAMVQVLADPSVLALRDHLVGLEKGGPRKFRLPPAVRRGMLMMMRATRDGIKDVNLGGLAALERLLPPGGPGPFRFTDAAGEEKARKALEAHPEGTLHFFFAFRKNGLAKTPKGLFETGEAYEKAALLPGLFAFRGMALDFALLRYMDASGVENLELKEQAPARRAARMVRLRIQDGVSKPEFANNWLAYLVAARDGGDFPLAWRVLKRAEREAGAGGFVLEVHRVGLWCKMGAYQEALTGAERLLELAKKPETKADPLAVKALTKWRDLAKQRLKGPPGKKPG